MNHNNQEEMKTKTYVIILLIICSLPAMSQRKEKVAFTPEHEFRLGIGAFPVMTFFNYYSSHTYLNYGNTILTTNEYNDATQYYSPRTITGSISGGYTYNVLRWLSVGATFSYIGDFQNKYDRITNQKSEEFNSNNFILTPMVRFNYLNKPLIRLYSQIGIGASLIRKKLMYDGSQYSSSLWGLTGQITFLGVAVGKQVFGFTEILGTGSQGTLVVGVGYRFNTKQ